MEYKNLLSKKGCKVLISGCSTSYNRHPYDDMPRSNATDCGVGMGSWSFRLRDYLITSDPQFVYGVDIDFPCEFVYGLDNVSDVPNTAMFEGNVKTLLPCGDVEFSVPVQNDEIILYLQRRIDSFATFDIEVDGKIVDTDISTLGDEKNFAGYGLMRIVLPCNKDKKGHTIKFKNIKGNKITVVGAGAKNIEINMSGRGAQTARFFIENFKERIEKFNPDLFIFNLGANDRDLNPPLVFRKDLSMLLQMVFESCPACKMLYLLPPSSCDPENPEMDYECYSSLHTIEAYDNIIKQVCGELGNDRIDLLSMRDVFANMEISEWRVDNIHLNRKGNDILFKAVKERLEI